AIGPVLSRLFTRSDFGVLGSFNSVVSVVAAFVTLQYSQALMLPKHDEDAANVFAASIISVFLVSLSGLLMAYIFSDWLLGLLKAPQSKWLLWFLPLGIFVAGINQSFQAWCIRRKAFTRTASSQMIRAGSVGTLQIVSGLLHHGGGGLITSSVAANGIASVNLSRQVLGVDKELLKESLNWRQIGRQAREYRDFPIYSATQNAMNALSQGLPVLLLAHFYGIAVAGFYAFGVKLLQAPMRLVLTALRQVLFQKASESYNQGHNLYSLYVKTTGGLVAAAMLPSIALFAWAPQLFSWVFGAEWWDAGVLARWLNLWMFAAFCNVPATLFGRILRQQRNLFLYECIILLSRTGILLVGGLYWSVLNTVVVFSLLGFVLNVVLILWIGTVLFQRRKTVD
ncbi:MAG: oligosaccharide flippase family protein, partial [Planctomycetes bacterium]|nr:oligosaccharide flippase family protein [Planctomycetota bacterium]